MQGMSQRICVAAQERNRCPILTTIAVLAAHVGSIAGVARAMIAAQHATKKLSLIVRMTFRRTTEASGLPTSCGEVTPIPVGTQRPAPRGAESDGGVGFHLNAYALESR